MGRPKASSHPKTSPGVCHRFCHPAASPSLLRRRRLSRPGRGSVHLKITNCMFTVKGNKPVQATVVISLAMIRPSRPCRGGPAGFPARPSALCSSARQSPPPDTAVFTVPALAQGPTSCSSWKEAGGNTPRCWGSSLPERWARSLARIVQSAVRTVRVAARFLTVRAQAFKQAPEERFVSCQACCPVGVGFGHEPLGILLEPCSVSRVVTKGHCLLPASSGLIVQRAGKVREAEVERTWRRRRC